MFEVFDVYSIQLFVFQYEKNLCPCNLQQTKSLKSVWIISQLLNIKLGCHLWSYYPLFVFCIKPETPGSRSSHSLQYSASTNILKKIDKKEPEEPVAAHSVVSVVTAESKNIRADDDLFENTKGKTGKSFEYNSEEMQLLEDGEIKIGVIIPFHQKISAYVLQSIKASPPMVPSGMVLRRVRRVVTGFRTKCIPMLIHFCKNFTVGGITKRFCVARNVFHCTALD